jgi:hypothetical protein
LRDGDAGSDETMPMPPFTYPHMPGMPPRRPEA